MQITRDVEPRGLASIVADPGISRGEPPDERGYVLEVILTNGVTVVASPCDGGNCCDIGTSCAALEPSLVEVWVEKLVREGRSFTTSIGKGEDSYRLRWSRQ